MTSAAFSEETTPVPWWLVLLEGIAILIFGILLLTRTGLTTIVAIQVLGIYWFVAGILSIVGIFIDSTAWGWKLFSGILGIIAGIIVVQHEVWSAVLVATTIIIIIAIQGIIIGGINIWRAFKGAGLGTGILGALSIIFGIILLLNPVLAASTLPIVIGIFAIVGGILSVVAAFRMR